MPGTISFPPTVKFLKNKNKKNLAVQNSCAEYNFCFHNLNNKMRQETKKQRQIRPSQEGANGPLTEKINLLVGQLPYHTAQYNNPMQGTTFFKAGSADEKFCSLHWILNGT